MGREKVVVTGGAGFIGSHLAAELVRRGYRVVILDDLSTGKMANIEPLLGKEDVEFIRGSITERPRLPQLFAGVHYVFHLAAITSVPRSLISPEATHEVNASGTLNVLLAARDNAVRKVIYASSAAVYGDTPALPQREDMPPQPQSPYAVSKLVGEYYCAVFHRVYGLPTVSLRYFNVYGPRQDPAAEYAAVVPQFISRVLPGKPPIIYGDGEQTRDFAFVLDAVAASILAAESGMTGVYNIGCGEGISINRLAELTMRLVGSDVIGVPPVHEAPRPGDIRHSVADISRARAFGFEPRYSLEQGLRETIRSWQREAL